MISLELYTQGVKSNGNAPQLQWGWKLTIQGRELTRSKTLYPSPLQAWTEGSDGVNRMLHALVRPEAQRS